MEEIKRRIKRLTVLFKCWHTGGHQPCRYGAGENALWNIVCFKCGTSLPHIHDEIFDWDAERDANGNQPMRVSPYPDIKDLVNAERIKNGEAAF